MIDYGKTSGLLLILSQEALETQEQDVARLAFRFQGLPLLLSQQANLQQEALETQEQILARLAFRFQGLPLLLKLQEYPQWGRIPHRRQPFQLPFPPHRWKWLGCVPGFAG